jgi:hypothetical protein
MALEEFRLPEGEDIPVPTPRPAPELPPLPPGFTLDTPRAKAGPSLPDKIPALPAGFKLDKPDLAPRLAKPEPVNFGSFGRGWNRLQQAGAMLAGEVGLMDPEDVAASVLQDEEDLKQYPVPEDVTKGLQQIMDARGITGTAKAIWGNLGVLPSVIGESLPMSLPGMATGAVGALGGAPGAMAGLGIGSGVTEYAASLIDYMADNGIDPGDADVVSAALANPEFMSGARDYAAKRGVAIGTFDALSAGLAGKVGATILHSGKTAKRLAGAGAAATGIEAAGGSGGEAAAQLATEGEIRPGEVALEGVAEIVPGLGEAAISAPRAKGAAQQAENRTDPAVEVPAFAVGDEVVLNDGPVDGFPGHPQHGQRARITDQSLDKNGQVRHEITFDDGSKTLVTDRLLVSPPQAETVAPEAATPTSGDEAGAGDGLVERSSGAPDPMGGDVVDGSPPVVASPPAIPAEPVSPDVSVAPDERALLRRSRMLDDDIDVMSREEVEAEVERVRQAGLAPTLEEISAAAEYRRERGPVASAEPVPGAAQPETPVARPEPAEPETGALSQEPGLTPDGSRQAPVKVETPEHLEQAGARVNTEPSEAQKEAGNYAHGHVKVAGIDIAIENPKGSIRTGKSPNGESWSVEMPAHYGRIKRTEGADGDQVDVYVGDDPKSRKVYVVDQIVPGGRFDEHKAIMGVNSVQEARDLYASAFNDGRGYQRIGAITAMPVSEFKRWLKEGDTKKPVRFGVEKTTEEGFPADAKGKVKRPPSLSEFLTRRGGIKDDPELRAMDALRVFIPGVGRLLTNRGVSLDEARRAAVEAGYLTEAMEGEQSTSTVDDLLQALRQDIAQKDVFSFADADWIAAWQAEQGSEQSARMEDKARDRVRAELKEFGYTADDDYAKRVVEIAVSRDMDTVDAMERAAIEIGDELGATSAADDIPFDTDERDRPDAIQPGTPPEGGARVRAESEQGARSEGEVEPEGSRAAETGGGEGRADQRGEAGDQRSTRPSAEERQPEEVTVEPGAEGKPQTVIPGAEKIPDKHLAERKAEQPLRPKVEQKDPGGLFGDDKDQLDLMDVKPPSARDASPANANIRPLSGEWVVEPVQREGEQWFQVVRSGGQQRSDFWGVFDTREEAEQQRAAATSRLSRNDYTAQALDPSIPDWKLTQGQYVTRKVGPKWAIARANRNLGDPDIIKITHKQYDTLVAEHRQIVEEAIARGDDVPRTVRLSADIDKRYSPARVGDDNPFPRLTDDQQKQVREIVFRVAGNVDFGFLESLAVENPRGWGRSGKLWMAGFYDPSVDAIRIALKGADPSTTAYHEAFHRLQMLFLNRGELRLLMAEHDRLKQIIRTDGRRDPELVDRMDAIEVQAEAFALWSHQMDRNNASGVRLHIGVRRLWNRIRNMLQRVSNYLDGLGFRSVEDVFGEAREGKIAEREARTAPNWMPVETGEAVFSIAERFPDVKPRDVPKALVTARISKSLQSTVARIKNISPNDRRTRDDGESMGDYLHRKWVDYLHPLRMMQEKTGATLNELNDAYMNARLAEDAALAEIQTMHDKYVTPMVEELRQAGASLEDLHRYLYALHAEERNRVVGLRNPEDSDLYRAVKDTSIKGASGMSSDEARAILAELQGRGEAFMALRRAGAQVRAMLDQSLKNQRRAGLISDETYRLLTEQWKNYVPLMGQDGMDAEGNWRPVSAGGFDVRGDEFKTALGRFSEADNVIANAVHHAEQSIFRQKKNDVGKAMLRFVNEFDPKGERIAQVYWSEEEGFGDISKAKEVHRRVIGSDGKVTTQKVRNPFSQADDVLATKVGGKTYYIRFADPKVGHALRKLGQVKLDTVSKMVRKVTAWQSIVNTRANPAFTPINVIRDVQTGAVHLLDEGFSGGQIAGVVSSIPKAWGALWRMSRGKPKDGDWDRWAKEYFDHGGKITFHGYSTMEDTLVQLQKDIAKGVSGRSVPADVFKRILKFVGDLNDAGENGIRLAAYVAARKNQNRSPKQAAFLARDLTVDFKKHGEVGPLMNSWYVFFNAALQGNYNIARRMAHSRKVQAAVGSFVFAGMMQGVWNSLMAGEDDDGESFYTKMLRNEPWKLERQFVFFLPGSSDYVSFPLPYGYNAFHHLGVQGQAIMTGQRDAVEGILDSARVAFDAFNPIGSGSIASMVAPTIADPAVEIIANENFFGSPIYPSENPFDAAPPPDSSRSFSTTHPAFKWIAEQMNEVTGGSAVEPGVVDVYPDTIEHLWGFFSGGLGRFFSQGQETMVRAVDGEFEPKKTPWVRSFYGQIDEDSQRTEYFRQREAVLAAEGYLKDYGEAGKPEAIEDFQRRHAVEISAIGAFKAAEKTRRGLNKQRRRIEADDSLSAAERKAELDRLAEMEIEVMREARKAYAAARREAAE